MPVFISFLADTGTKRLRSISQNRSFLFLIAIREKRLFPMNFLLSQGKQYAGESIRGKQKTAEELRQQVRAMFEGESWKRFTERNFKAFPRYVRDQCLEAKRYFMAKEIDTSVLEQALEYCLENNTLSFANLNDTYAYFKREHDGSKDILQETQALALECHINYEPLDVNQRNLSVYKELIGKRERPHESL